MLFMTFWKCSPYSAWSVCIAASMDALVLLGIYIYARANLEMKRKVLEKVAIVPDASNVPFRTDDKDFLSWLAGYGRFVSCPHAPAAPVGAILGHVRYPLSCLG